MLLQGKKITHIFFKTSEAWAYFAQYIKGENCIYNSICENHQW